MREGVFMVVSAVAIVATCGVADAQPASIQITVLNEKNQGVKSIVALKRDGKKTRFGETDTTGKIQRPYQCQLGETFQANPMDRGAYFSSKEEDCRDRVILRVLGRQTPLGAAIGVVAEPVQAGRDSEWKYVVLAKGLSQEKLQDTPGGRCELLVEAKAVPELYAVDKNAYWTKLAHSAGTRTSNVKFLYNRPCALVSPQDTKAKAAEVVSAYINETAFSRDSEIRNSVESFEPNR